MQGAYIYVEVACEPAAALAFGAVARFTRDVARLPGGECSKCHDSKKARLQELHVGRGLEECDVYDKRNKLAFKIGLLGVLFMQKDLWAKTC